MCRPSPIRPKFLESALGWPANARKHKMLNIFYHQAVQVGSGDVYKFQAQSNLYAGLGCGGPGFKTPSLSHGIFQAGLEGS